MRLEVRRAKLDDDLRDLFEQYGEQVVAMALALGSNQGTGLRTHPVAPTHAMNFVHANLIYDAEKGEDDGQGEILREPQDQSD
jgi:hypothetical protein